MEIRFPSFTLCPWQNNITLIQVTFSWLVCFFLTVQVITSDNSRNESRTINFRKQYHQTWSWIINHKSIDFLKTVVFPNDVSRSIKWQYKQEQIHTPISITKRMGIRPLFRVRKLNLLKEQCYQKRNWFHKSSKRNRYARESIRAML